MILWDDEQANEDNVFEFPYARSSQTQFLTSFLSITVIRWNVSAFRPIEISVTTKIVPRLIAKRRMERLEVKNCSWTKQRVFVNV